MSACYVAGGYTAPIAVGGAVVAGLSRSSCRRCFVASWCARRRCGASPRPCSRGSRAGQRGLARRAVHCRCPAAIGCGGACAARRAGFVSGCAVILPCPRVARLNPWRSSSRILGAWSAPLKSTCSRPFNVGCSKGSSIGNRGGCRPAHDRARLVARAAQLSADRPTTANGNRGPQPCRPTARGRAHSAPREDPT